MFIVVYMNVYSSACTFSPLIDDCCRWNTIDYTMSAKPSQKKPPVGGVATQVASSRLPTLSHHIKQEKDEGISFSGVQGFYGDGYY